MRFSLFGLCSGAIQVRSRRDAFPMPAVSALGCYTAKVGILVFCCCCTRRDVISKVNNIFFSLLGDDFLVGFNFLRIYCLYVLFTNTQMTLISNMYIERIKRLYLNQSGFQRITKIFFLLFFPYHLNGLYDRFYYLFNVYVEF